MESSNDVFDHTFSQVKKYHDYPYGFQHSPKLHSGRIVIDLGSGEKEFMAVRYDLVKRIQELLDTKNPNDGDGHVTADYLAGLGDNFGKVEESWQERAKHMISTDGITKDYQHFSQLEDAVEANKGYPFLCRVHDQFGPCHSMIVLGRLGDGTVMGFEHRGEGTDWGFCEVGKAIQARRGEDLMCKRL